LKAATFPAPSHSTVWSAAAVPMTGSVVSSIVNVALVVELLLQASVAVNTTVTCLVFHSRPPSFQQHSHLSRRLPHRIHRWHPNRHGRLTMRESSNVPAPSHSTVWLAAAVPMTGSVVSSIVNVALVVELLLQASVAVNTTVTCLVFPQSPTQFPTT